MAEKKDEKVRTGALHSGGGGFPGTKAPLKDEPSTERETKTSVKETREWN